MKLVRFWDGEKISYGSLKADKIKVIEGNVFFNYQVGSKSFNINEVQILAPCEPSKVVCIGLNYVDHAKELTMEVPGEPIVFLKPNSAVTATGTSIIYPPQCTRLDYEAELAVVIGSIARNVSIQEASEKILGYTCANDITARNLQRKGAQWTLAKSFDTFCPIGPHIVTNISPDNLKIRLILNGKTMQNSNTSQMIFSVDFLVSYLSRYMTLFPGDVIITGTPPGVGPMNSGDVVEVKIEKIGNLKNIVGQKNKAGF